MIGNLADHFVARHLIRQFADDDFVFIDGIYRAHPVAATSGGLNFEQLIGRRDDFGTSGQVGCGNISGEFFVSQIGVFQQGDGAFDHLAQIVRRNIGGHPDGNASGSIEQNIGQARRQGDGLLHRAIKVVLPLDRALAQLAEQRFAIGRQLGFGIAHGGKRFGIIR